MLRFTRLLFIAFCLMVVSHPLIGQDSVYKVGSGVTAPQILTKVNPQYTEEARKANISGNVLLEAIVHKDGTVTVVRVVRGLGYGLDEAATDAFSQWRFAPAQKDGNPVDVSMNVEINFNRQN